MVSNKQFIISWVLQVVLAIIIGQTLYFKFIAHPESVAIFTELKVEPYGRIFAGFVEFIAVFLLLLPSAALYGALLSFGVISGAILSHIFILGWSGERGSLGLLAIICWVIALILIVLHKSELRRLFDKFKKSNT